MIARLVRALGAIFTLPTLALAAPADAQVAASASLATDYIYRGVSLSDGTPALSVNASYESGKGVYVGGSVVGETALDEVRLLGEVEYVGYSGRTARGLSWDLGVTNINYNEYYRSTYYNVKIDQYNTELYAGFHNGLLSYYLYYSPHYFANGAQTLYAEIDGSVRPARRWRLFGHVGALTFLNTAAPVGGRREQFDAQAGVATEIKGVELKLALTAHGPDNSYPLERSGHREALVLGATLPF